jgi:hypothetical protein
MSGLMTFFSIELVVCLIAVFVMGFMLRSKGFGEKKKNLFGSVLLGLSLFNLVFFNAFIVKDFTYGITEIVSIVLLFLITFATGLVLLVAKEVSERLRKFLGFLLIILPIIWLVMMAFAS